MANYESVTRSNYFHVKDEDAFSKFMDTVSGDDMHCWSDKDEDGNTLHAFGCDGSIYGVPNGAEDNDFVHNIIKGQKAKTSANLDVLEQLRKEY